MLPFLPFMCTISLSSLETKCANLNHIYHKSPQLLSKDDFKHTKRRIAHNIQPFHRLRQTF